MLVYLVRHAWAEERGPQWPDDDLRPLNKAGVTRFRSVARKLAKRGVSPEVIATSPLVRCRQTADILAGELDDVHVVEFEALAPGSDLDALLRWTAQHEKVDVAWVGHAPDIGELLADLIGGGEIEFNKGAVAAVEFAETPTAGAGVLRWFTTAKLLGC